MHRALAGRECQPADSDMSVVFRGDGEPKTPQSMLQRLIACDAQAGIEADSYSLGGTVETLERQFAALLNKAAAVFMPTGDAGESPRYTEAVRHEAACHRAGAVSSLPR